LVDEDGRIVIQRRRPTPDASAESVLAAMIRTAAVVRSESPNGDVLGVGFAMPHFVIGNDWVQLQTYNVPTLEGIAIRPPLMAAFGPAIACDNDLLAAGIAEWHFGGHGGAGRLLYMAIGTGISCAIIDDGLPLRFTFGALGEIGHVIVDPIDGTPCLCGGKGCLEAVAAGPAIARSGLRAANTMESPELARQLRLKGRIAAADVASCANQGDEAARAVFDRAGRQIGIALTSLIHIFGPTTIVIGGGVAQAGELLLSPVRGAVHEFTSAFYRARLTGIHQSALRDEAGILGAAALVLFPSKSR
jgi:glucokinase